MRRSLFYPFITQNPSSGVTLRHGRGGVFCSGEALSEYSEMCHNRNSLSLRKGHQKTPEEQL